MQMIRAGHHRAGSHGALASEQQQELLRWAEERVASCEPYSVTMAGKSPQKLHHLKLMYGVADEKGLLPNYNFSLTKAGWKRVQLMPELLRRSAEQIGRETGTTLNNCVVNIYLTGADSRTAVASLNPSSQCILTARGLRGISYSTLWMAPRSKGSTCTAATPMSSRVS